MYLYSNYFIPKLFKCFTTKLIKIFHTYTMLKYKVIINQNKHFFQLIVKNFFIIYRLFNFTA